MSHVDLALVFVRGSNNLYLAPIDEDSRAFAVIHFREMRVALNELARRHQGQGFTEPGLRALAAEVRSLLEQAFYPRTFSVADQAV